MPHSEIVVFDPRGTGRGALRCRDLEAATVTDAGREAAACATLLGERRQFFRAADTVEDIELLRAELGVERRGSIRSSATRPRQLRGCWLSCVAADARGSPATLRATRGGSWRSWRIGPSAGRSWDPGAAAARRR
jgi:hypothetical protein